MPQLTRPQLIAWSAVGLVILLIGANYLRGHLQEGSERATVVTTSLKEDRPAEIKVHVTGAVARPGLYQMTGGDRVADALERAGGPTPNADLSLINLAAKLADGQQVTVPEKGAPGAQAPMQAGTGSSAAGAAGSTGQPLNLNSATAQQLETLDGIGPKTAQKIIDYREAKGGFKSVDELLEVPGIGPAKFEQIKDQVCA